MKNYEITMWEWVSNYIMEPTSKEVIDLKGFMKDLGELIDDGPNKAKAILAFNLMMNHYEGCEGIPTHFDFKTLIEPATRELLRNFPNVHTAFTLWVYG